MKLKLEEQSGITVLTVTEDVQTAQVAVLKAGLNKIVQSGKKSLLLDLTGVTQVNPMDLADLPTLVFPDAGDAKFFIASKLEGIGHAPTREEGLKLFTSVLANLLAAEARLQAKVQKLSQRKTELEGKLASGGGAEADLLKLKRENSDLKALTKWLEGQLEYFLKRRKEPFISDGLLAKRQEFEKVMAPILKSEGLVVE